MLKIKDSIDLVWLATNFDLRVAEHVDDMCKYIFYTDYLYINPATRQIIIEKVGAKEIEKLYDLIKANVVEKV